MVWAWARVSPVTGPGDGFLSSASAWTRISGDNNDGIYEILMVFDVPLGTPAGDYTITVHATDEIGNAHPGLLLETLLTLTE